MSNRAAAILVGVVVFFVLFFGFSLFSWSAIHGGLGRWGDAFGIAWMTVPIAGGILAGLWSFFRR